MSFLEIPEYSIHPLKREAGQLTRNEVYLGRRYRPQPHTVQWPRHRQIDSLMRWKKIRLSGSVSARAQHLEWQILTQKSILKRYVMRTRDKISVQLCQNIVVSSMGQAEAEVCPW